MVIYPAIDLYGGKAVRLYKGDYNQMTVYNDDPTQVARDFLSQGATHIHLVDLEGAKSGTSPNFETICRLKKETGLYCQTGGGIRTMERIARTLEAGIDRVILGTAAVTEAGFVEAAVQKYGEQIAVGIDIRDGFVAIRGWTEKTGLEAMEFCGKMAAIGVKTLICTDISKDGAMQGTNHALYRQLKDRFDLQIIASGGVSSLADIEKLAALDIHGAIIGKAYYTGAIDLRRALEAAG